ncbi:MAG TPA: magnesium transporter [Bacteroidales bacterium]|nr:magnesium transporter [Bacteroidales bacterium]
MVDIKIKAEVLDFLQKKDLISLRQNLKEYDTFQIAEIIEDLPKPNDVFLFRLLPRELAKEIFQHLSHDKQEEIVDSFAKNLGEISILLNDLDPDDRTAFLEELPGEVTQKLLQLLSDQERNVAISLLGYPEDSIGRLMTPEYVSVKPSFTIAQALDHIRKFGHDSETLNIIYVVDDYQKLIDEIRIKEIILASPNKLISDLMDYRYVALNVMNDQETAVKMFKDYDRVALPVVNDEGILLGIVTFDDIMDVVEEESTEDFHKFGSFQSAITNPLKEKAFKMVKYRIPWLITLVFVNIFSSGALATYESVIESMVSLVFFLPLLIGSGGNAGSQAATLMIRSLVVGDVKLYHWYKLLGKEIIVSFMLGAAMAIGVALIASVRAPEIVVVVALTMVLIVMTGSLIGLLLPFIFTKLKLDPATASAPLITSITDICGVVIYFSIASWYFGF